ncbi:MAG: 5-deoxy-glucuronate isomerase [Actinobacteria bacterium]|nr:5-deoxy-glucuronate isomerase [Actinomycetota bacterium]
MNLLVKSSNYVSREGIVNIVSSNGSSDLKYIGLDILKLEKGNSFSSIKNGIETAVAFSSNICSIELENVKYENIGWRDDIFEENATAVYIPSGEKFSIKALENIEAGICYAKSDKKKVPFLVKPENVRTREVGKDNYKRFVKDIIYDIHDVDKFIIGETISKNGNWSSFPPHKHDRDMLPIESKFEEIYLFRMYPSQGFAIQKIYTEDGGIDETYTIKDYDSVIIPRGYHPVVGCPGYKVYYFWILGGEKREYKLFEDEKHSWINKK